MNDPPGVRGTQATRRSLVVAGAAIAILLAVVAVRGGTAATDADLAPAPSPPIDSTAPGPGSPEAAVSWDGIPGARLGQAVFDGDPQWPADPALADSQPRDGCLLVAPAAETISQGVTVRAWVLREQIGSVVVTGSGARDVTFTSPQGVGLGDPLEAAARLPGAEVQRERLAVPAGVAGDEVESLRVVTVTTGRRETLYSDLGGTQGIQYIEVRDPAARGCALEPTTGLGVDARAEAELSAAGWGPVRIGLPVADLLAAGIVGPAAEPPSGSCPVHPAGASAPEGLVEVAARDGVVVGLTLTGGRTSAGLAVGDPVAEVLRRYPTALRASDPADQSGWSVDLGSGGALEVTAAIASVTPRSVDVLLRATQPTVTRLRVGPADCR